MAFTLGGVVVFSKLGQERDSLMTDLFPPFFFVLVSFESMSARVFCSRGIYLISSWSNFFIKGFGSGKVNEVSKGPIKSHMLTNMVKHPYAKFQDSQHKIAQSKTLIAQQSTVGVKWSFDSQKFKFLVNILF